MSKSLVEIIVSQVHQWKKLGRMMPEIRHPHPRYEARTVVNAMLGRE